MERTHHGQHGDTCFGCRIQSVQFAGASPMAIEIRKRDRQLVKDGDAYRRLKKDGIQPIGTTRVAELEANIDHPMEAKLGRKLNQSEQRLVRRQAGNNTKHI